MYYDDLITFFKDLCDKEKEVNGEKVLKTKEEMEQEIYALLSETYATPDLSTSEIKNLENSVNKRYKDNNVIDEEDGHLIQFHLERTSGSEETKKDELSKRAREIFIRGSIKKGLSTGIFTFLETGKDGKPMGVPRSVINILTPDIDHMSYADMKKFNDDFDKKTTEEKYAYFKNNLKKMDEFIEKLGQAENDEEFVNLMDGNFHFFSVIGELQYEDNNLRALKETFGIELKEEDKKLWQKLAPLGVDLVNKRNLLGTIASPYYSKYKDACLLAKLSLAAYNEGTDQFGDKIQEMFEGTSNGKSRMNYQERTGRAFPQFTQLGRANGLLYSTKEYESMNYGSILSMHAAAVSENVKYRDMEGNEITFEAASDLIRKKQYVDVYDGKQFKERFHKVGEFYLNHSEKRKDYRLDYADVENRKELFSHMKDILDKENPLYVRIEAATGIGNSGKYQKVVDDLETLLKGDFKDTEKLKKDMDSLSKSMSSYLSEKLTDGKEKSDLTNSREKAMLEVYNTLKPIIDYNDPTLEENVEFVLEGLEENEEIVPFDLDEKKEDAMNIINGKEEEVLE